MFRADRGVEMALHGDWTAVDAAGRVIMAQALSSNFGREMLPDSRLTQLCKPGELQRAHCWGLAMRLGQRLSGGVASVLEETSLINQAGYWVMGTALALLARWRASGRDLVRLAINVSARELRQEGFLERCAELIDAAHDDHGLDIEVTESLLMDDITQNIRVLDALRDLGCQIAIDDFGTG